MSGIANRETTVTIFKGKTKYPTTPPDSTIEILHAYLGYLALTLDALRSIKNFQKMGK